MPRPRGIRTNNPTAFTLLRAGVTLQHPSGGQRAPDLERQQIEIMNPHGLRANVWNLNTKGLAAAMLDDGWQRLVDVP